MGAAPPGLSLCPQGAPEDLPLGWALHAWDEPCAPRHIASGMCPEAVLCIPGMLPRDAPCASTVRCTLGCAQCLWAEPCVPNTHTRTCPGLCSRMHPVCSGEHHRAPHNMLCLLGCAMLPQDVCQDGPGLHHATLDNVGMPPRMCVGSNVCLRMCQGICWNPQDVLCAPGCPLGAVPLWLLPSALPAGVTSVFLHWMLHQCDGGLDRLAAPGLAVAAGREGTVPRAPLWKRKRSMGLPGHPRAAWAAPTGCGHLQGTFLQNHRTTEPWNGLG